VGVRPALTASAIERLKAEDELDTVALMATFEESAALSDARRYASAAAFDIQKLDEDSIERQALHNLLNAVEALIQSVDATDDAQD
jgi:hypothetical protein